MLECNEDNSMTEEEFQATILISEIKKQMKDARDKLKSLKIQVNPTRLITKYILKIATLTTICSGMALLFIGAIIGLSMLTIVMILGLASALATLLIWVRGSIYIVDKLSNYYKKRAILETTEIITELSENLIHAKTQLNGFQAKKNKETKEKPEIPEPEWIVDKSQIEGIEEYLNSLCNPPELPLEKGMALKYTI